MTANRRRKPKIGRPKGSGKPVEEVRRHRVAVMLNDSELANLEALSESQDLPLSTVAYRLVVKGLKSKLRAGA